MHFQWIPEIESNCSIKINFNNLTIYNNNEMPVVIQWVHQLQQLGYGNKLFQYTHKPWIIKFTHKFHQLKAASVIDS